jgi:hypothetical protein
MDYSKRVKRARSIGDIFAIVRDLVENALGTDQAGLLVGLSDLGCYQNGYIGAYYTPAANTIVINTRPLQGLLQSRPELYNAYLFHVMLHEYIHSLGCYDEQATRFLVEEMSRDFFGSEHEVTQFAANMQELLPDITYASSEFEPPEDVSIDFVLGIDRKNTNYIN